MRIIVCIKQVPDTREVKIDPETGNLIRQGIPSIINPDDVHALEEALRIREQHGGEVIVITMGPPQAEEALREALAMGADRAILVGDKAFAGADTWATARTLGKVVNKLGDFDIIICGWEAIDGNTAQVGPELAEFLGLPQITFVNKTYTDGNKIKARRVFEEGYEILETNLPVLLTVVKSINEPRFAPFDMILQAYTEKEIEKWNIKDIGGESERELFGIKGSPTKIRKSSTMKYSKKSLVILGDSLEEAAYTLVDVLSKKQII